MADRIKAGAGLSDVPDWYKDAIIYELHVRSFYDSDGDGIGDFRGLTEKLDYLHDLGVTAIWLLPFFPSPLRDDGYDIADYKNVNPSYGTLRDFKQFVQEAHRRGLRVITELVLNHTSDQHPWFQRARRAKPGSIQRNFYVWTDRPDTYRDVRIIFQDFESSNWSWDPVAKAYFWHRFYSHQPDLNFDSPHVRGEAPKLLDFWLKMGVDGLRLDAVPYLFEREGTSCENLPETHEYLKELRRHVDERFKNRMLLAEANQWPEDAAEYFGNDDECHMAFHFPIMPRLFIAVYGEDRHPIIDSLTHTPEIPPNCQWAVFLRNHDELTLEMVTDEERDYMYRVYAQDRQARINLGIRRRLAPLMGNNRRKIELMNSLLFSLPGTPVLYYGDEIGMGDNIYLGDRDGVRTPMQWSPDRNAGFSRANPQSLFLPPIIESEYHYQAINVETQQNNPSSLLWWTRRLIALRRNFKAFGRGALEFLYPSNRKVLAFIRRYEEERLLVVANLSRFFQYVELDLSDFQGAVPIELFGRTEFPPIGHSPYALTLGPHGFVWFSLERPSAETAEPAVEPERLPTVELTGTWTAALRKESKGKLERALPEFIRKRRWFQGRNRRITSAVIEEVLRGGAAHTRFCLALVKVQYTEGVPEEYFLPLGYAGEESESSAPTDAPRAPICRITFKDRDETGYIYDAGSDPDFAPRLFEMIAGRKSLKGWIGHMVGKPSKAFKTLRNSVSDSLEPSFPPTNSLHTSVFLGDRFVLKMYRRVEHGVNSEAEIGRFLARKAFPFAAPFAGELEYRRSPKQGEPMIPAVLHGYVHNEGDAWSYTLDRLNQYLEEMPARRPNPDDLQIPPAYASASEHADLPEICYDSIGSYLEFARLLGERTAQLHTTLASDDDDPAFSPEPFTALHQRSMFQSMRTLSNQVFSQLKQLISGLPDHARTAAEEIVDREPDALKVFGAVLYEKFSTVRIRCHGDYHLGRILCAGADVVVTDFGGEPTRSLSERRIKRSPLRDVAGMLRSFHYAAYAALFEQREAGLLRDEEAYGDLLIRFWSAWVGVAFLRSYMAAAGRAPFVPKSSAELRTMLNVYVLEKAVYELGYELNNRPQWIKIPLEGIRRILD